MKVCERRWCGWMPAASLAVLLAWVGWIGSARADESCPAAAKEGNKACPIQEGLTPILSQIPGLSQLYALTGCGEEECSALDVRCAAECSATKACATSACATGACPTSACATKTCATKTCATKTCATKTCATTACASAANTSCPSEKCATKKCAAPQQQASAPRGQLRIGLGLSSKSGLTGQVILEKFPRPEAAAAAGAGEIETPVSQQLQFYPSVQYFPAAPTSIPPMCVPFTTVTLCEDGAVCCAAAQGEQCCTTKTSTSACASPSPSNQCTTSPCATSQVNKCATACCDVAGKAVCSATIAGVREGQPSCCPCEVSSCCPCDEAAQEAQHTLTACPVMGAQGAAHGHLVQAMMDFVHEREELKSELFEVLLANSRLESELQWMQEREQLREEARQARLEVQKLQSQIDVMAQEQTLRTQCLELTLENERLKAELRVAQRPVEAPTQGGSSARAARIHRGESVQ